MINPQLGDVGHTIQLSIAPVFLLSGVGTTLIVLTNRLARIIDRSRILEDIVPDKGQACPKPALREELNELYQRAHLINRAITLSTSCALLICLVIAALFAGEALDMQFDRLIACLFVAGVIALIGSFAFFLREIFVATKTLTRQREHGTRQ